MNNAHLTSLEKVFSGFSTGNSREGGLFFSSMDRDLRRKTAIHLRISPKKSAPEILKMVSPSLCPTLAAKFRNARR
jgi:hypothetical protein